MVSDIMTSKPLNLQARSTPSHTGPPSHTHIWPDHHTAPQWPHYQETQHRPNLYYLHYRLSLLSEPQVTKYPAPSAAKKKDNGASIVVCFYLQHRVCLAGAGCVNGVVQHSLPAGKLKLGEPLVDKVPEGGVGHHLAVHTKVREVCQVAGVQLLTGQVS